jgi:hypothetical protein
MLVTPGRVRPSRLLAALLLASLLPVQSGLVVGQSDGASPMVAAAPSPSASALPSPMVAAAGAPLPIAALADVTDLAWAPLRSAGGPAPREDHTWTVDAGGTVAWLFGGRDGGREYADLWRFDLASATWTEVAVDGRRPSARFGHAAAWVPDVGLVIFAGQQGADFFDELWAFDPGPGAWRKLPARGARPAPRYGTCAGLGADGRLWISHGFTFRGRFDDTRAYDFGTRTWHDETPPGKRPSQRCLHDCFWSSDGRLVLYGGQDDASASLGDAWALDPAAGWSRLPDPTAAARRLYAVAVDARAAWIFGGAAEDGSRLGDLWRVDRATLEWQEASPAGRAPAGRSAGTLLFDEASAARLLLFGGEGRSARRADLWQLAPRAEAEAEVEAGS